MAEEKTIMVKVSELSPHPRNQDFFDDIDGEKWEDFKESIKTSGVLQDLIITDSTSVLPNTIVSGEQRWKASQAVGKKEVPCKIRHYDNELDIIRDLIEINLQQRGTISSSKRKQGNIAKALEAIYEVKEGRPSKKTVVNHHGFSEDGENLTREDIAAKLGVSPEQLRVAKAISTLVPELGAKVDEGQIPAFVAARLLPKLSEAEQLDLVQKLPATGKVKAAEIQNLVTKWKEADLAKDEALEKAKEAKKELTALQRERGSAPTQTTLADEERAKLEKEKEALQKERDAAKEAARKALQDAQKTKAEMEALQSTKKSTESDKLAAIQAENAKLKAELEAAKIAPATSPTSAAPILDSFRNPTGVTTDSAEVEKVMTSLARINKATNDLNDFLVHNRYLATELDKAQLKVASGSIKDSKDTLDSIYEILA